MYDINVEAENLDPAEIKEIFTNKAYTSDEREICVKKNWDSKSHLTHIISHLPKTDRLWRRIRDRIVELQHM
jgi:hypothetical protein